MNKKYVVRLSEQERQTCTDVVKKLKVRRDEILLKTDVDGPSWTDAKIAEAFNCRLQTIENLRKRLVTESFELALNGKKRQTPPTQPLLDGQGEAKLISMRLGKPPAGYGRWTLQLLADELVALEVVDSISHETVRQTLKNGMTKRMIEYWVIPPEADAEFVANMEEVLEVYERPYDPAHPVLCMDEQPVQLLKVTRVPIAATKNHAKRADYRIRAKRDCQYFYIRRTVSRISTGTARP